MKGLQRLFRSPVQSIGSYLGLYQPVHRRRAARVPSRHLESGGRVIHRPCHDSSHESPKEPCIPTGDPRMLGLAFSGLLVGASFSEKVLPFGPTEIRLERGLRQALKRGISPMALPHLPTNLAQLFESLEEGRSVREIAGLIRRDPALAAEVLHVANSPAFCTREPSATLEAAFMRLGETGLKAVVAAAMLRPAFRVKQLHFRLFGSHLWQHAMDCGRVCWTFAPGYGVDPSVAFFAGLVHDVGKLEVFRQGLTLLRGPEAQLRPAALCLLMEAYGPSLTRAICAQWNIPVPVKEGLMERSETAPARLTPLGRLLAEADAVSEAHALLSARAMPKRKVIAHMQARGVPWLRIYEVFPQHRTIPIT